MKHLPPHAKLVFEGERSRVYHWEQTLYDGSTATFESIVRRHTATVLALVGDQLIIQKQEQPHKERPFLSLPGGFADTWDEDPLAIAKRELLEETGMISDDWALWKVLGSTGYIHWENHIFIARNCQQVAEPSLDAGEKIESSLISLDELLALVENPDFRHKDLFQEFYRMQQDESLKKSFWKFLLEAQ